VIDRLSQVCSWAVGELPKLDRDEDSTSLLWLVGLFASAAMFMGEFYNLPGHPLTRGFWRSTVHGGLPLVGIALWSTWKGGRGRGLAVASFLVLLVPIIVRLQGRPGANQLRESPEWMVLPALLALGLAGAAILRSGAKLAKWGVGLGDWRWWLPRVGAAALMLVPVVFLAMSFSPKLASFYPSWKPARLSVENLLIQQVGIGIDFIGWELLFRGFLLFGVARRGDAHTAIWLQAIPFFLLHSGQPDVELVSSLFGGLLAGWVCLRARSFIPLFILHWAQMIVVACCGYLLR